MHFTTLASISALLATAAASTAELADLSATCPQSASDRVRVFNRCPYKVHLWSVLKLPGCPSQASVVLQPGESYCEKARDPENGIGVSIKISKTDQCDNGNFDNIVQLEYYLERGGDPKYQWNYFDVSYVDATGGDSPTQAEGFYLKSGNVGDFPTASENNENCPILSCSNHADCAKVAYIKWDDRQTKSCALDAPLDFYLCGGEPGDENDSTPPVSEKPKSSEAPSSTEEAPEPSSVKEETPTLTAAAVQVAEEKQITSAPVALPPKIKTAIEVVYVTKVEYVHGKRHAHGHGHQHFRA